MEPGPAASPGPSRSFKEELLCAVCYDPFRDAVTLHCGHNFCRGCVSRCWEVQVAPTCPVCKDRASPADLRTNHTLNNLVEKLLREEAEGARWAGPRSPRLCRLHRGQLSLFCLEDKELLCCSCQADPRHRGHRMQPVKDTAHDFRAKCRNMECTLREKAKAFWAMRRSYEAIAKHNQVEAAWLEGRIRQEFDKLREFLRVEEQAVLDAVAQETRQKQLLADEKMKQLTEETEVLAQEIERLQMELKEDDVSFLMKHKSRKRRLFCTVEPEPIQPGMLINPCRYLDSLQYRVWKKMISSIKSVPFSFDPNTAAGWLSVSDDLTSVTNHGYRVQILGILLLTLPLRPSGLGSGYAHGKVAILLAASPSPRVFLEYSPTCALTPHSDIHPRGSSALYTACLILLLNPSMCCHQMHHPLVSNGHPEWPPLLTCSCAFLHCSFQSSLWLDSVLLGVLAPSHMTPEHQAVTPTLPGTHRAICITVTCCWLLGLFWLYLLHHLCADVSGHTSYLPGLMSSSADLP
ncbi:E3 ubiquitin-protein ligase TRIM35 isoform X3 [Ictidomys tridecemlineatus]